MRKITVTIGIPAHNEEKNIGNLLESIINQDHSMFDLKKILIILDGCSDRTLSVVKRYKTRLPSLVVINDGKHLGKSARLNMMYKRASTDILVTFDADTVLGSKESLIHLVKLFRSKKVGLVGGHDIPVKPKTIFEKVVSFSDCIWYETRRNINNGITIHNHHSCISAIHKNVYKKIRIPEKAIADDDFVFISTSRLGYEFRFASDAILKYRCPASLREYVSQSVRFLNLKREIARYFGNNIYRYYSVPTSNKIRAITTCFIKNPILFTAAIGLQLVSRVMLLKVTSKTNGYWNVISSSKSIPESEIFVNI